MKLSGVTNKKVVQKSSNHLTYLADIIERVGWVRKVMCTASELCYWR